MNSEELQAARNDTIRYLGYSERTEYQLREYLAGRDYDLKIIESISLWAVENGLVDDLRFALIFIRSHTGKGKSPFGSARIRQELKAKGVSHEIIDRALNGRNDEDMFNDLVKIVVTKYGKSSRERAYRRASAYLNRRGFSSEMSFRILETAIDASGEDG